MGSQSGLTARETDTCARACTPHIATLWNVSKLMLGLFLTATCRTTSFGRYCEHPPHAGRSNLGTARIKISRARARACARHTYFWNFNLWNFNSLFLGLLLTQLPGGGHRSGSIHLMLVSRGWEPHVKIARARVRTSPSGFFVAKLTIVPCPFFTTWQRLSTGTLCRWCKMSTHLNHTEESEFGTTRWEYACAHTDSVHFSFNSLQVCFFSANAICL